MTHCCKFVTLLTAEFVHTVVWAGSTWGSNLIGRPSLKVSTKEQKLFRFCKAENNIPTQKLIKSSLNIFSLLYEDLFSYFLLYNLNKTHSLLQIPKWPHWTLSMTFLHILFCLSVCSPNINACIQNTQHDPL